MKKIHLDDFKPLAVHILVMIGAYLFMTDIQTWVSESDSIREYYWIISLPCHFIMALLGGIAGLEILYLGNKYEKSDISSS